MAQFTQQLSNTSGGGLNAPSPVVDTTPLAVAQTVGTFANIFANKALKDEDARQQALAVESENRGKSVIANYMKEQLKIADAVDRGELKSSEGRMLMRTRTLQALNDNQLLAKEITEAQRTLTTTSGLAKSTAEGTEAEARIAQARKKASGDGFIYEGMTEEQEQKAMFDHSKFLKAKSDMELVRAQVGLESSKIGLSKDALSLMQARRKETSQRAVAELAEAYAPKFRGDVSRIMADFQSGKMDQNSAIAAVKDAFNQVNNIPTAATTRAGREYMTDIVAPMKNTMENALDVLTGKSTVENYQSEINKILVTEQLNALRANPDFAKAAAVSKIMPNIPADLVPTFTESTQNVFMNNRDLSKKPADLISANSPDNKIYFTTLERSIKGIDKMDEAGLEELSVNISQVLKGVPRHADSEDRVEDYKQVVDFFANPSFAKYVSSVGLNSEEGQKAKEILQSNYSDVVLPVVQDSYSKALTSIRPAKASKKKFSNRPSLEEKVTKEATLALIAPEFAGGGVTFRVDADLSGDELKRAKEAASLLNERTAKVINKMIRMSAHLEGHTNYNKIYAEQFANLFSPKPENEES